MVVKRNKKVKKYRGNKTHGWGSMKKHRGAGNRGGRGLAGTGKRAGHRVHWVIKNFGKGYLGRKGFTSKSSKLIRSINLKDIESKLETYLKNGLIKKESGALFIDLAKIGYDKILGSGTISNKYKIKARFVSKKAKEKIESLGGEIVAN